MAIFPILSSGAVTQYPTASGYTQAVQTIRFIDGSDQRYLFQARALRQCVIGRVHLNESDIQQIVAFFEAMQGDYALFSFVDPASSAEIPNCRLSSSMMLSHYDGLDRSKTSLEVVESYG